MRKAWFLAFLLVALAGSWLQAQSGGDPLRGTWYGGSSNPDNAGYKYQYTFIPTGKDRWYVMADGAYNPDSLGAAVWTTWTGEVVKRSGRYEIRMIALLTNDPVHPPEELPTIHGVMGLLTLNSERQVTINYDTWAAYKWGDDPFVSEPQSWMLAPGKGPPITEVINRMSMGK